MKVDRRGFFGLLGIAAVPQAIHALKPQETKPTVSSPAPLLPSGLPQLEWRGSTYEGVTADSLLVPEFGPQALWGECAKGKYPAPSEVSDSWAFFRGDQWNQEVGKARMLTGRPCLVLNRIPQLVATVIANSSAAGRIFLDKDIDLVVVAVVRQNRDAQLMHNYLTSCAVENARVIHAHELSSPA